jgi:hypothetical protein
MCARRLRMCLLNAFRIYFSIATKKRECLAEFCAVIVTAGTIWLDEREIKMSEEFELFTHSEPRMVSISFGRR